MLFTACGPAREGDTARIHDSWNARFHYDLEKRRLVSSYDQRKRGRTWGRDEFGRVDFDRYWSGRPIPSQNLLSEHHRRMDFLRRKDGTPPKGKDWQTGPKRWRGKRPARTKRKARRSHPNLRMKIRRTSFRDLPSSRNRTPNNPPGNMEDAPFAPSLRIQACPLWKEMSRPRLTWKNRPPLSPSLSFRRESP